MKQQDSLHKFAFVPGQLYCQSSWILCQVYYIFYLLGFFSRSTILLILLVSLPGLLYLRSAWILCQVHYIFYPFGFFSRSTILLILLDSLLGLLLLSILSDSVIGSPDPSVVFPAVLLQFLLSAL